MTHDMTRKLVESIEEADTIGAIGKAVGKVLSVPARAAGAVSKAGGAGMSAAGKSLGGVEESPCSKCGGSMAQGRCSKCGCAEDSGLQTYGREPSGGMAEGMLTVEDVEKICPECAASMRERRVSGVKLESVLQSGIFEESDDEDAVLIEKEGEEGWPKKLKTGRFTNYCKESGMSGPSEACAKKAMESADEDVRGMASIYTNSFKVTEGKIPPQFLAKAKDKKKGATPIKGKKECGNRRGDEEEEEELDESTTMAYDEGISEMVGIDAIKAWAATRLPEGIRITTNTVMIGNKRVAERNVDAKHARMLKPNSLTEDAARRTLDVIERGLRDAGYKIELIDSFAG